LNKHIGLELVENYNGFKLSLQGELLYCIIIDQTTLGQIHIFFYRYLTYLVKSR